MKKITILFMLLSLSLFIFGQKECSVLLKDINETYVGKCKRGLANGKGKAKGKDRYEGHFRKGLPHGKGTYIWSSGEIYIGQWKKGKREGKGKLTIKINKRDSVLDGLWENNNYKGPKPKRPKVTQQRNVDRYSIRKRAEGNSVLVNIYQNGAKNTSIEEFDIIGDSGVEYGNGSSVGYENIVFPFFCKISYSTWNKQRTSRRHVYFDFIIYEEAQWSIDIHN